MTDPHLSIVIPIYRNADHLTPLNKRLVKTLLKINPHFEIIYVCDGSPDNSWLKIQELATSDCRVKGINFSQNYGQQSAILAGLSSVKGMWVIVMDGDLQDQPEDITILYETAINDAKDIVVRRRINRKDSIFTKLTSALYYRVYNFLIDDIKYDGATGNFGIYSQKVIRAINQFKEDDPSFAYYAKMVGFSKKYIDIEQNFRESGNSSYTFSKRLALALNYFISHSTKPIKIMIGFGLCISVISVVTGLIFIYRYYEYGVSIEGWTSIAVLLFFQTGLITFFLGMIGLYVSKIFLQSKNRPHYIVQETINLENEIRNF
ncbi:hypothetical protein A8O14_01640 [Polynucleobacter wuianus]|uniref:Glycosyltransferase 2-like domain-containing protein n=1 Tax=Polynucleobacter wuianus TaxID=1743168 RepID=A0A191UD17_9BURK|nr:MULTISPECIES: glycosyltransferase family 2 protein [Polynucleobacter]ANI98909.1 hypothetical protein A8O14_01640 [Polynucleobacter wuianus]MBU3553732.1 glycosyltransferase family 2 protein [Polynucleobacter sp. MWH-Post4-6-1]